LGDAYSMAIVSSVLTQAQIDQLVSLRDQLGSNNTTLGAGRAARNKNAGM
jgi:hypothetical protein